MIQNLVHRNHTLNHLVLILQRVLHTPITDVEQLKFDLVGQLENIDVMIKYVL